MKWAHLKRTIAYACRHYDLKEVKAGFGYLHMDMRKEQEPPARGEEQGLSNLEQFLALSEAAQASALRYAKATQAQEEESLSQWFDEQARLHIEKESRQQAEAELPIQNDNE